MPGIATVFGGAAISRPGFETPEELEALFKLLESENVNTIDTAQIYGDSEKLLGQAKAGSRFVIDTKHAGGIKPGSTRQDVVNWAKESIEKLNMDQVSLLFL